MKSVVISRHKLLPAQETALQALGAEVVEICEQYNPKVDNPRWEAQGVKAVFTVALPPHLLQHLSEAFRVFLFEMESVGTTTDETEAQRWCAEDPERRIYLPAREGSLRLLKFVAVSEIKIEIQTKRVWTVQA
ncbi:MAG: hypothetical protein P3X24_005905 [bacterium]|nr:hypothetical protein [bacterium]